MTVYRPGQQVWRHTMDNNWYVEIQPVINGDGRVIFIYHNWQEDLHIRGSPLGFRIPLDYGEHDEKDDEGCCCKACRLWNVRRSLFQDVYRN